MRARIVSSLVVLLASLSLLLTPQHAQGSEWWCWDDPIVVVNGHAIRVLAGVPNEARASVGLADIVITVPAGLDAAIRAVPSPRFPQRAVLERGGTPNADGSFTVAAQLTLDAPTGTAAAIMLRDGGQNSEMAKGVAGIPVTVSLTIEPRGKRADGSDRGAP